MKLENYHKEYMQGLLVSSEASGQSINNVFVEKYLSDLAESGEITPEYTIAEYLKNKISVSGFDIDEERQCLSIFSTELFQNYEKIQSLTSDIIKSRFNSLEEYFEKCLNGLYKNLEETSESHDMSFGIKEAVDNGIVNKVKFYILTDGKNNSRTKTIPQKKVGEFLYEFIIVTIENIHLMNMVNFIERTVEVETDLKALKVDLMNDSKYESYLTVVPGDFIFDIYDKYGKKLLEQNVRTFLGKKGNVNKGIRNTIILNSDMFFAYNNGITATASGVEWNDKTGKIEKIYDLQIVNGGQTVSSIYSTKKVDKSDLDGIFVQMKLSVIKEKPQENNFVSKVAEYANAQNKVSKADFFSNSEFHIEFKKHSTRILAPRISGFQTQSYWFYERVRGEYMNELAYLTPAKKEQFKILHPKKQVVDKQLLMRVETIWRMKPWIASKGAQDTMVFMANELTDKLEKDNLLISEEFFKDSIAKIMLFKYLEENITTKKALWYKGGYRAQVVAYTLALFVKSCEQQKKAFNLSKIWSNGIPADLGDILLKLARDVYDNLLDPPLGSGKASPNIFRWAKQESCWKFLEELDLLIDVDKKYLIGYEEVKLATRTVKKEQKLIKSIDNQILVAKIEEEIWYKIAKHYTTFSELTEKENSILNQHISSFLTGKIVTEKQCLVLVNIYERAVKEGVVEKSDGLLNKEISF